ncbi:MAG: uracil-DNA glycosylase [Candidatus Saccharimonadales bacterium]
MINKQTELDEIMIEILADNVCPDLADGATQIVFGAGNVDADVVFVGEAPGKNEDIQGVPFVGASGKFLDEMLDSIGLDRQDVYITNIVKYRPPNNRDPLPKEKSTFLSYLIRQLEVINPKLIVTLGRHSMDVLLPGLKISEVHGQPKWVKRSMISSGKDLRIADEAPSRASLGLLWAILPLYHPAAALYNGSLRQILALDFAAIPKILDNIYSDLNLTNANKIIT